ncbi:hypothetical protein DSO57_1033476 [Entomophthora muscae]|uniref:Uncharacterized protein n=1 Tax=Entomophthora muscae TaxID=34485 RepID=A0ACC2UK66_9FUNG|nr:hypothetical protein DSO57_1033476 [Entomophthora muscae]
MVCCGSFINRLCGAMRELEAQLAEVRSEVQEGRFRCSQAQFSALQVPHADLERAPLSVSQLALPTRMIPSHPPQDDKACHLYLWSLLPQKKLLVLTAQSLLQEHHNRTSLRTTNETLLLL